MEPDSTALDDNVIPETMDTSTPELMADLSSSSERFTGHRELIRWVLAHNGYLDAHVHIAWNSQKGFHALVASGQTIVSGTRIASCPMELTLSVLNALDIEPFESRGTKFPSAFLRSQVATPESLQAFYLMDQLVLGDKSWWAPYVKTLPTVDEVNEMQFKDEADLAWLQGTNLSTGFAAQTERWRAYFDKGMHQLSELEWPAAKDGSYTWEKFRWAATIFGSRSFTSLVLDETLPADRARFREQVAGSAYDLVKLFGERFAVLLPLVDILNHKPGAQVEWQARYGWVGMQLLESYRAGEELYNNYGPRDNEGLLLAYGFTIPDNPFDHVVLSMKPPPGSPLAMTRRWKRDERSDVEFRCFLFGFAHPSSAAAPAVETSVFSFDLLDGVSVLSANTRELQAMQERRRTLFSEHLGDIYGRCTFEDGRNILATLASLLLNCTARAARLISTDPSRGQAPSQSSAAAPASAKQHHAKVYRDSQLRIVQTAIAVARYTLLTAIRPAHTPERTIVQTLDLDAATTRDLTTLLSRHKRLTHPSSLLSSRSLIALLPESLSRSISTYTESLLGLLTATLPDHPTQQKVSLTLVLASLLTTNEDTDSRRALPSRIAGWFRLALPRYPHDADSSWAYVPADDADDVDPALLALLNVASMRESEHEPQRDATGAVARRPRARDLCWAWNVLEEESVVVPAGLLAAGVDGDGDGNEDSDGGVFLYLEP